MNSKSLLIAIAALALTATGAQAFTGDALINAGLTDEQRSAFEEARELRKEGNVEGARDVLVEAGIDETVIEKVKSAMHEQRHSEHKAIKEAIEADDYDAFKEAIKDSPLADVITTESDFEAFKEAHLLMKAGDREKAETIFTDLGITRPEGKRDHDNRRGGKFLDELTDAQKQAFQAARQANDKDAMDAILEEAGIERPVKGDVPHFLKDGRELDR